MRLKIVFGIVLFLATVTYCYPGQSKVNVVGQWVITSVLNYDTNIPMRFDGDDIHFTYGTMGEKIYVYKRSQ
jgi:hypothetical protein